MSQKDSASESATRFCQDSLYGNTSDYSSNISFHSSDNTARVKLGESEEKQRRLRERVVKTQAFTPREQSALNIDSKDAFKRFWESALDAKTAFDTEHEHGAGRLSKDANSLAASAYDILQGVSPMVDLVKNFGSPYGGMAIGTICFLFAVGS